MSKILLIGYNPVPFQRNSKLEAANYRAWQFVQPLLDEGHSVCLCVHHTSERPTPADIPPNLVWEAIPFDKMGWPRRLQQVHDAFQPDGIVGVDYYPALYATQLKTSKPMWFDLYGDPLTIVQVARYRTGTDQGVGTAIALTRKILERGDVFSACGVPQQHALVGELAMSGRLNSRTFAYSFVNVVYPGAPPIAFSPQLQVDQTIRQAHGIGSDAFVVLWCGGYNTWTDVSILHRALEHAMAQNPRIHFVSVGASTYQAPETQYDRFAKLVAQSLYTARYHLLGWRPWKEVPEFYRAGDVGISIDALHYETIYGTRTRLVEMLAYGLPVITTEGCELSYMIRDKRTGLTFAVGDWEALAQHILELASKPELIQSMRQASRVLTQQDLSFQTTTAALRVWAKAPQLAPDHLATERLGRVKLMKYKMRTAARLLLWRLGQSGRR